MNNFEPEYMDFVNCMNCEFIGLVEPGSEQCPECLAIGALAWEDDDNQQMTDEQYVQYIQNGIRRIYGNDR